MNDGAEIVTLSHCLMGRLSLFLKFQIGDELKFDMVRADNSESKGEYAW